MPAMKASLVLKVAHHLYENSNLLHMRRAMQSHLTSSRVSQLVEPAIEIGKEVRAASTADVTKECLGAISIAVESQQQEPMIRVTKEALALVTAGTTHLLQGTTPASEGATSVLQAVITLAIVVVAIHPPIIHHHSQVAVETIIGHPTPITTTIEVSSLSCNLHFSYQNDC